jgi:protein gp37
VYSAGCLTRVEHKLFPAFDNVRGTYNKPLCFVCDTGDLFHEDVPAWFIIEAFEMMAWRKEVDWVVLTKRPERMASVLFGEEGHYYLGGGDYYRNVILGVTAENQDMADERIPWLVNNWEGPRLVCVEPMLGPVDLGDMADKVSWVICGGESGTHRRPFDKLWASELYAECRDAGVPFYFKQGSALRPGQDDLLGIHQVRVREWPR